MLASVEEAVALLVLVVGFVRRSPVGDRRVPLLGTNCFWKPPSGVYVAKHRVLRRLKSLLEDVGDFDHLNP